MLRSALTAPARPPLCSAAHLPSIAYADDAACDKSAINKGVRLTVKKGDGNGENICHSKYERKVEIDFQCGTGLGAPVFVSEETNCLYRFEWRTELACEDHAILPSAGNGGDTDDDDQPENTNTNTNSGPQAPNAHLLDCTYTDDKQGDTIRYAASAVQFHPDGGQFDFGWLSARTPHGAYVW